MSNGNTLTWTLDPARSTEVATADGAVYSVTQTRPDTWVAWADLGAGIEERLGPLWSSAEAARRECEAHHAVEQARMAQRERKAVA